MKSGLSGDITKRSKSRWESDFIWNKVRAGRPSRDRSGDGSGCKAIVADGSHPTRTVVKAAAAIMTDGVQPLQPVESLLHAVCAPPLAIASLCTP